MNTKKSFKKCYVDVVPATNKNISYDVVMKLLYNPSHRQMQNKWTKNAYFCEYLCILIKLFRLFFYKLIEAYFIRIGNLSVDRANKKLSKHKTSI